MTQRGIRKGQEEVIKAQILKKEVIYKELHDIIGNECRDVKVQKQRCRISIKEHQKAVCKTILVEGDELEIKEKIGNYTWKEQ